MSVQRIVSHIWKTNFPEVAEGLARALESGAARCPVRPRVWFRADDVGVPSRAFKAMADLFRRHETPLALAVTPAWLTPRRFDAVRVQAGEGAWCWHQHGRRHMNHEPEGRKCEFGPARSREAKRRDLALGMERLDRIMGRKFTPVFTPPWNRFDPETGELLARLGFMGVSRDDKAFLRTPAPLPEIMINCDLHTRGSGPAAGWDGLFSEIAHWTGRGLLGFMLHHQRMNARALAFLDTLLGTLRGLPGVEAATLADLLAAPPVLD